MSETLLFEEGGVVFYNRTTPFEKTIYQIPTEQTIEQYFNGLLDRFCCGACSNGFVPCTAGAGEAGESVFVRVNGFTASVAEQHAIDCLEFLEVALQFAPKS